MLTSATHVTQEPAANEPVATLRNSLTARPLVSVVTPFYNTETYLAECIESVLRQTYSEFEYLLVDNCSTDRPTDIAAAYARKDCRIRLVRCTEFLPQVPNYNRALRCISPASEYCKMVQADDAILPECLEQMVLAFGQSPSIGLVSSYWLEEDRVWGSGFPRRTTMLPGIECARLYFRAGNASWLSLLPGVSHEPPGFFGSPTQVMYRSSVVRSEADFFDVNFQFNDLQKALDILQNWDFGFVHQILTFTRRENFSFISSLNPVAPFWSALYYTIAKRYAPIFMSPGEARKIVKQYKRQYYRELAEAVLRLKGDEFWRYHLAMVKSLDADEALDWGYLVLQVGAVSLWLLANPGRTAAHVGRYVQRWGDTTGPSKTAPAADRLLSAN